MQDQWGRQPLGEPRRSTTWLRLVPRLAPKDEVPFGRRRAMTRDMFLDACERVCEHLLVYTWGGRVAPWVLCSCVRVGVACVPLCLRRAAGFVLARVLRVCAILQWFGD